MSSPDAPISSDADLRLEVAVRAANLGVWDWNLVTDRIVYSARARQICGFPPWGELTLDDILGVTHPDDRPLTAEIARRARGGDAVADTSFEYRIIRPDGEQRWVVAHGETLFDVVDGVRRPVRYIGALRDVTETHAARERQEAATARLRLAMAAGRMAVWDYDVLADRLTGSPELHGLLGMSADGGESGPLTLERVRVGLLPGEAERVKAVGAAAIARGERFIETEYGYRKPGGGVRWHLLRAEFVLNSAGALVQAMGVLMDVTERRRTEQALRESEARFRAMADSAPTLVWQASADGDIDFVNKTFCEYAGRDAGAMMGDAWISLVHPDDMPGLAASWRGARDAPAGPAAYSFEARFMKAAGDYRSMLASARPHFRESGKLAGYIGMAIDITELRQTEAALRESEARFRLVAEGAPVMLWMSDPGGGYIYVNKALRDFWGVGEDLEAFSWAATLWPEDQQALSARFEAAMDNQEPFEAEARYLRADGAVRILRTRAQPRRDAKGEFLGMIGVNMDVTDVRLAEEKQQLLMNELNHRVKNTLMTVQSIAHQTLRPGADARQVRDALIQRIMALSGAHNVLTRESWEGADIADIVREAVQPYDAPGLPRVSLTGPARRLSPNGALALSMAVHELATNACKYGALSAPVGEVVVTWGGGDDPSRLNFEWREQGGPPVRPPERRGFGSRLLQSGLATVLKGGAKLTYAPEGVIARFVITLEG